MTNPTPLSPAAQAVLDAVLQKSNLSPTVSVAAAALRAAADQVVPNVEYSMESPWQVGFADRDAQLRRDILDIANELEAQ